MVIPTFLASHHWQLKAIKYKVQVKNINKFLNFKLKIDWHQGLKCFFSSTEQI
jgi:hypothetical protein